MRFFSYAVLLTGLMIPAASVAQDAVPPRPALDLMPAKAISLQDEMGNTHPMLHLTPEKSELIRLEKDAISVVIGNPQHLSVLLDTPRVLVLIPRAPGATQFTVLDQTGQIVMQRHVIVGGPKEKYLRVRRSCAGAEEGSGCQQTSVYFCPDICHEVSVTQMGTELEESEIPEEVPGVSGSTATEGSE